MTRMHWPRRIRDYVILTVGAGIKSGLRRAPPRKKISIRGFFGMFLCPGFLDGPANDGFSSAKRLISSGTGSFLRQADYCRQTRLLPEILIWRGRRARLL